jgi:hypothetical protein
MVRVARHGIAIEDEHSVRPCRANENGDLEDDAAAVDLRQGPIQKGPQTHPGDPQDGGSLGRRPPPKLQGAPLPEVAPTVPQHPLESRRSAPARVAVASPSRLPRGSLAKRPVQAGTALVIGRSRPRLLLVCAVRTCDPRKPGLRPVLRGAGPDTPVARFAGSPAAPRRDAHGSTATSRRVRIGR